jgi:transglutaminase-like putative cysteine protease
MYSFRVLENVAGSKYAVVYTTDETISIEDSYMPFLCASDYVNYTENSACVKKAKEFASSAKDTKSFIASVYEFICSTITYDKEKVRTVQSGYLAVPDETMKTGKGICFDYASLMGAMLRSQGIPTRLEIGYAGTEYHAWISVYTKETGWIDKIIQFDGTDWTLMDPTLGSYASNSQVKKTLDDTTYYQLKYKY